MTESIRTIVEQAGPQAVALWERIRASLPELQTAIDAAHEARNEEEHRQAMEKVDAYLETYDPMIRRLEAMTGRELNLGSRRRGRPAQVN